MFDLSQSTVAVVLILFGAFLIHVPLLWARSRNVLPIYASIFLFLDPFTTVGGSDEIVYIKVARIYCTGLMIVSALISRSKPQFGLASGSFLVFAMFFAFSALWSDEPIAALEAKVAIFLPALCAGICLGDRFRTPAESQAAMRPLIVTAFVFSLIMLPEAMSDLARGIVRFQPWGLNAVRLGVSGYSFFAIGLAGLIADRNWWFKIMSGVAAYSMGIVLVMTGSRGPAAVALIIVACITLFGVRWRLKGGIVAILGLACAALLCTFLLGSRNYSNFEREGFTGREMIWGTSFFSNE